MRELLFALCSRKGYLSFINKGDLIQLCRMCCVVGLAVWCYVDVGRKQKLTALDRRRTIHAGRTGQYLATQIRNKYEIYVTVRRLQQVRSSAAHLSYTRMLRAPNLTPFRVQRRLSWARSQLHQNPRMWYRTVYREEKRFCLDGTDRVAHYLADYRLPLAFFTAARMAEGWSSFGELRVFLP